MTTRARHRRTPPRLRLPLPEHLPRRRAELLAAQTGPKRVRTAPVSAAPRAGRNEREAVAYDAHFGVERVRGAAGAVLREAMTTAYQAVFDDVVVSGSALTTEQWRELLAARDAVLAPATELKAAPPRVRAMSEAAGLRRWQTGHWLFFTLVQGLIVAVTSVRDATERGEGLEARASLDLASVLTVSSAAAMHYASDFPVETYERAVRPSMAPPFAPPGFSGLQGRDHRHLIHEFGLLRGLPIDLASFGEEYRDFVAAVRDLHRAHRRVCAHFVGDQPSLRTHASSDGGHETRSATAVLDAIAARRLALLPPVRPPDDAARLARAKHER